MLHIKSEKKCKTSHLSSQNEIFFVFIKISTCVKIIGYLQRYGLMFKTSLQLSLTSYSSISLLIFFKNSNGYYMCLACFRENEHYYTNIEPRWQTKPNITRTSSVDVFNNTFTIRYCTIPKNVFSHCFT